MVANVEQIIREYLPDVVHLSLATVRGERPWVCEVHFAYDDELNLYFRSLPSRRHSQEIADNPHVAGNVVKQHGLSDPPVGVYFEGTARRLPAGREQDKAFARIKARLHADDAVLAEAQTPDGHQFYQITVENWYVFGRFGGPSNQKYHLPWNGGQR